MRREGGKGGLGFVLRFLLGLEACLAKRRRTSGATRERNERSKKRSAPKRGEAEAEVWGLLRGLPLDSSSERGGFPKGVPLGRVAKRSTDRRNGVL